MAIIAIAVADFVTLSFIAVCLRQAHDTAVFMGVLTLIIAIILNIVSINNLINYIKHK